MSHRKKHHHQRRVRLGGWVAPMMPPLSNVQFTGDPGQLPADPGPGDSGGDSGGGDAGAGAAV